LGVGGWGDCFCQKKVLDLDEIQHWWANLTSD
jgi:hypothetical protein